MDNRTAGVAIYCGSATPALAAAVAGHLGLTLGGRELTRFPDGEVRVQLEQSVRGRDIYIIQSTCAPVNEHLMELLILIDAFHRASAGRITAIIPYYGYARQEKKTTGREPITAKLVANLIAEAGAHRVVAVDLHSAAIQGFFDIGMDHLTAVPLIAEYLRATFDLTNTVVVAPDTGGAKLADSYAFMLNLPLVVMHKRRASPHDVEVRAVVGSVIGKRPIIVDDIIATGGTIRACAHALVEAGALPEVIVAATHPVFSPPVADYLNDPLISSVIVTDTIPIPAALRLPKVQELSVAPLLAEAITRLHTDRSISEYLRAHRERRPV
jgi:ribose-phosphate pyrophosphokinase